MMTSPSAMEQLSTGLGLDWKPNLMTSEAEDKSQRELAYASFAVFADDGSLDLGELNFILGLALRDGVITDGEKEVLRGVFNRVLEPNVSAEVWQRIQAVRQQHGI